MKLYALDQICNSFKKSVAFLEYLTECLCFSVMMVNKNNIYCLDSMLSFGDSDLVN